MRYLFFIMMLVFSVNSYAQHCPWDGAVLIAVKLVDQKGRPVDITKDTLYLQEVDNPLAGSCSYEAGLLKKPLLNTSAIFVQWEKRYGANYGETLKKRLKVMGVIGKSDLMVGLNQAETYCMIKNNDGFDSKTRKFVIVYTSGNKKMSIPVPKEAIRSLCTGSKDFVDFKPIEIKI